MVVYDFDDWILGRWARQIRRIYGGTYDIRLLSMYDIDRSVMGRRLIKKSELVHAMLPHSFGMIRALRPGKPIIAAIHHWVDWSFVSSVARNADALMVGSRQWRANLIAQGIPEEKITVVNCGIEERFLRDHEPILEKTERLSIGFFSKNTSNEDDRKGTRHFKALLSKISARGMQDRIRVVISGPGWRELVAEIRNEGFEVEYMEFLDDAKMPGLYASLDLYLMLSDVDGGPATVIEAMASRCVIVASNIGLVQQVVRNDVNGIVVDNTDYDGIADVILSFQRNAPSAQTMRRNAYETASNMLFDDTLKPLGALYASFLSMAGRPAAKKSVPA